MYWIHYYYINGADLDCFETDDENTDIDSGKCDVGKKAQRVGRGREEACRNGERGRKMLNEFRKVLS